MKPPAPQAPAARGDRVTTGIEFTPVVFFVLGILLAASLLQH